MQDKEDLFNERITILYKDHQLRVLERIANKKGLPLSTYIRLVSLKEVEDYKAERYLKKLQAEANQRKDDTD